MTRFKNALLLATVAGGALLACAAQAQTNIAAPASNDGEAVLHGVGATSIQNVLVQELNCIGGHNDLGLVAGTTSTLSEPSDLPYSGGTFDCATQALEPNFSAKYVATGSGFGKTAWEAASGSNPFTGSNVNPFGTWTSVQFAFSDSNISSTDISTYSTTVSSVAGPAVFFPKYVLPVALAYNPTYGATSTVSMHFNVQAPKAILGVTAGGLQLNASTYCEIANGYITNWNDAAITADNNGVALFDPTTDTSTRWTSEGAPIRLIGRMDRSGTTDIFTRHLTAVCSLPGVMYTDTTGHPENNHLNKFQRNAETLPYYHDASSPNFASIRSDTGLNPTSSAASANSTNDSAHMAVSNTYFVNATTGFASVSGGVSGTPTLSGSLVNGSGLFIVANGSGAVANAINFAPDYVSPTGVRLNGKIGYIGSDFVTPAPNGTGLFSAALKGSAGASSDSSDYLMPSAEEGRNAVGTVKAPQTDNLGTYVASDTARGLRTDPLAWTSALYSATGSDNLANPRFGYPITGTTQFAGYTCYKSGNANAIRNFLGWNMQTITTDSSGASKEGVFTIDDASTVNASGLLARSNIGLMPNAWQSAINQSFLSGSDGLGLKITDVADGGVCSGLTGR
jgi:ABC-type phosphate transport system substrate-binding protein